MQGFYIVQEIYLTAFTAYTIFKVFDVNIFTLMSPRFKAKGRV